MYSIWSGPYRLAMVSETIMSMDYTMTQNNPTKNDVLISCMLEPLLNSFDGD